MSLPSLKYAGSLSAGNLHIRFIIVITDRRVRVCLSAGFVVNLCGASKSKPSEEGERSY